MNRVVRSFLIAQIVLFLAGASVHFGWTLSGYEHWKAGTAETVIAAVLTFGLITSRFAFEVQGFALFGTLIGVVMISIGVGPQTTADILFHIVLLIVLISGLVITRRISPSA